VKILFLYIKFLAFIEMVQQNHKTIVVSERNYETLRNLGTITESFNDVISKLLEKAASGQSSFEGPIGQTAVALVDRNDQEVGTAN
jgi:Putative antitoxin